MPKLENLLQQITARKKKKVPLNWGRCAHLSGSPRLLSATIAFKISTFAKGKKKKKESKELKWNESHEQSQNYHIRKAAGRKIKRRKAVGKRSEFLQFTGPRGPREGGGFPKGNP